jgi:hypothetical protein
MREIEAYCTRNPSFTYESARAALQAKEDRRYGYGTPYLSDTDQGEDY